MARRGPLAQARRTFGVLATLVLAAGCGSSDDSKSTTTAAAATSTTTTTTTAAAKPAAATIAVVMKEFTVTPTPALHYVLLCNLPGHYKDGQHHDLKVK